MNLTKVIQKIIGKPDFSLSNDVPLSYILGKATVYARGLLKGIFVKYKIKGSKKKLFVGRQVKLKDKKKIEFGDSVRIESGTIIDALSTEGVILGDRVKIGEDSRILCSGSLKKLGRGLVIGNDSSFSENTFFGAAGGIKIGNDVIAGQNVRFHSENHNFSDLNELIRNQGVTNKGITVGDNCWIGSGVVFLDGAHVPEGCVIGANSVVNGVFEKNSIIVGSPAKSIKKR